MLTTHLGTRVFIDMLHNPLLSYTVVGSKAEITCYMAIVITTEHPGP